MTAHLFIAHFPVALITVGAAADVLGAATRREGLRRAAGWLLVLGAAAALLAFFTGQGAYGAALSRVDPGSPRLEAHTQWGGAGVWALAAAGGLRLAWRERLEGAPGWITLALAVVSAALVIAISLSGTAISHGS